MLNIKLLSVETDLKKRTFRIDVDWKTDWSDSIITGKFIGSVCALKYVVSTEIYSAFKKFRLKTLYSPEEFLLRFSVQFFVG